MSTENSTIARLSSSIKSISHGFQRMTHNLENLSRVNDSLDAFNRSFGSFFLGMAINDTTIDWKKGPSDRDIELFKERKKQLASIEATKAVALLKESQVANTTAPHTVANSPAKSITPIRPSSTIPPQNRKRKPMDQRIIRTVKKRKPEPVPVETTSRPKHMAKINIKRTIDSLPLKFRESADPRANMEAVLKALRVHPSGLSFRDIAAVTNVPQHKVTDCVNALIHAKVVHRIEEESKASLFKLDPVKYPFHTVSQIR
ncbi:hypothetical protein A0J61_07162 [Choanephora cucurbitarum]|uniref:Uncharacterized protein n=1 Tax=Choanephora cucurbitarum TaxID=101091 RepID=A0A1C7N6K6_9FUNG|nr:hypothetical protein A0J61_07162 [Choanephora cucurbitarum]